MKFLFSFIFLLLSPTVFADDTDQAQQIDGDYVATSCKWLEDVPRRKVAAPQSLLCGSGAGEAIDELCMGYVVCNAKSDSAAKFVRMATCGGDKCMDAAACVSAPGYGSHKPNDNDRESVSQRVKNRAKAAQEQ